MGKPLPQQLRTAVSPVVAAPTAVSSQEIVPTSDLVILAPETPAVSQPFTPTPRAAYMRRREFLTRGAKTIAFLAAFQAASGRQEVQAQLGFDPFMYGVASGDPLPDRVIIWTRVTPSAAATPGSGLGAAVRGTWEIALDAAFTQRVAFGRFTTAVASDHTVKIDVAGLQPYTQYYYRFNALNVNSPVGRTMTAPAVNSSPASVRFGMVSCSNFEAGYFRSYHHLAQRDDLDFILHLGDYIYEYANGQYGPDGFAGVTRAHDPATEITTLSDYRRRHACYKADGDLRALHARYAFIATWDDHETANNAWREGAENHTEGAEGSWMQRRAWGMQAYYEWMPVRQPAPTGSLGEVRPIYRKFTFGNLADLLMLDLRQYRDEQPASPVDSATINSPTRTLLGSQQGQWLSQNLVSSTAKWKVMGNSVQIAPVVVVPAHPAVPPQTAALLEQFFGIPASTSFPAPTNIDSWDGYGQARLQLLGLIAGAATGTPIPNCVFLTGDIHSSFVCDVPANPGNYAATPASLATEFVCASVSSDNINEIVGAPERVSNGSGGYVRNPATPGFETLLQAFNAWIKHVNLDFHGFTVIDITSQRLHADFYVLRSDSSAQYAADPRIDPAAPCVHLTSYQTLDLSQRVSTAAGPLGARS